MSGLTSGRYLFCLRCQPQQHNATSNNNSNQHTDDAMTGPDLNGRACLLPNKATTRQARHMHPPSKVLLGGKTACHPSFSPKVTLQGTKPSKHRHLCFRHRANRVPVTANTLLCRGREAVPNSKCTRIYSHHGLISISSTPGAPSTSGHVLPPPSKLVSNQCALRVVGRSPTQWATTLEESGWAWCNRCGR